MTSKKCVSCCSSNLFQKTAKSRKHNEVKILKGHTDIWRTLSVNVKTSPPFLPTPGNDEDWKNCDVPNRLRAAGSC